MRAVSCGRSRVGLQPIRFELRRDKVKTTVRFIVAAVAVLLSSGALKAQSPAPATIGGFQTQGSVTAGYRFTDISGRQQKYRELFDLRKGFRVTDFDLSGSAAESSNPA